MRVLMVHVHAYVLTITTGRIKKGRITATKNGDRAGVGCLLRIANREVIARKCIVPEVDMIISRGSRFVHKSKSVLGVQSDTGGGECAGAGINNHLAVLSTTVRIARP
jgi:hypothetical protein